MEGNPNGGELLGKWSNFPGKEISYIPNASLDTVRSIDSGVILLMAFWSGYAIKSFAELTRVLHDLNAKDVRLVVVDVDGSERLNELPEFKKKLMFGYGQVAWVRNGQIIASSEAGRLDTDCFKEHTVALLWGSEGTSVSFPTVPENIKWLAPWQPLSTSGEGFVRELKRELSSEHILFGIPVAALARRSDCDDVLFGTVDPMKPLSVVHLTWRGQSERGSAWPSATIYTDWQDWIERRMIPDHEECTG